MNPVERFKEVYNQLDASNLHRLDEIYAEDVRFRDPVHAIEGREALREYLARLYDGVEDCHFDYGEVLSDDRRAMIAWTMRFRHRRFNKGRTIEVVGVSSIEFDDKVTRHHDYFDMGQMIYERVPVLGALIRRIKSRL